MRKGAHLYVKNNFTERGVKKRLINCLRINNFQWN